MLKGFKAVALAAIVGATAFANVAKAEVIRELRYSGNYLTTVEGTDGCLGLCRLTGYIHFYTAPGEFVVVDGAFPHHVQILNPATFSFTDGVRTVDQDFARVNNAGASFEFWLNDAGQIDFSAGWVTNIQFQEGTDPYQLSVFRSTFTGTGLLGNYGQLDQSYDILPLDRLALTDLAGQWTFTDNINAVPEPSTWAMMLAGFGMLGWTVRRRRQVATCDRGNPIDFRSPRWTHRAG
jgi:hypothetical protein